MRVIIRHTLGFAIVLAALGAPALAEERSNPFVKPPTAAEEQARQDERTRNIVREMQPEIKSALMQDVKASQSALEIDLRRRIDAVAASAAKPDNSVIAGDAPITDQKKTAGKSGAVTIPEGAQFISCVNGQALYVDPKDKSFFKVKGDGAGNDVCAR